MIRYVLSVRLGALLRHEVMIATLLVMMAGVKTLHQCMGAVLLMT